MSKKLTGLFLLGVLLILSLSPVAAQDDLTSEALVGFTTGLLGEESEIGQTVYYSVILGSGPDALTFDTGAVAGQFCQTYRGRLGDFWRNQPRSGCPFCPPQLPSAATISANRRRHGESWHHWAFDSPSRYRHYGWHVEYHYVRVRGVKRRSGTRHCDSFVEVSGGSYDSSTASLDFHQSWAGRKINRG